MEGHLSQYCLKAVRGSRCEPDSHTLYTHMTHITSPDFPNVYNRCEIGLQREFTKIGKANEIAEVGTENWFTTPNHLGLGEENNKAQFNSETRECDCCGGKHNALFPLKRDMHLITEPFCPLEGNIQNFNNRANKNPDGLPISIGEAQHE